jgi:hypothetical protein
LWEHKGSYNPSYSFGSYSDSSAPFDPSYGSPYGSYGSPYGSSYSSPYGLSYGSPYDSTYGSGYDSYALYNKNGDNVYLNNKNANQNDNYRSAVNTELQTNIQTLMDEIDVLIAGL